MSTRLRAGHATCRLPGQGAGEQEYVSAFSKELVVVVGSLENAGLLVREYSFRVSSIGNVRPAVRD